MTTTTAESFLVPRVDAFGKVTGQALYTEDLPLPPGTIYARILRSPYAHARLLSIDAEKAERLPGVVAVVTRKHLGGLNPFVDPTSFGGEGEGSAPLIAMAKVRGSFTDAVDSLSRVTMWAMGCQLIGDSVGSNTSPRDGFDRISLLTQSAPRRLPRMR